MLIWDQTQADAAELRRLAAAAGPGVETFVRDDGPGSLLVAETGRPAVPGTPKEMNILFTGGDKGPAGGDWLFFVGLWTPADFRDEFLAWYECEHLPVLLECRSWDGCRFVEERVADGCQFHAMHQLSDKAGLDSTERKRSRATPWFKRLAQHAWFDGGFTRRLYRRLPAAIA